MGSTLDRRIAIVVAITLLATAIQIGNSSSEMSRLPTANALNTPDTPPRT